MTMRYISNKKSKILFVFIFVCLSSIFIANYLYFLSYKHLGFKAYIGLTYDAVIATVGSLSRRLDLRGDPQAEDLVKIRLFVEPASLKTMVSALPDSAKAHYYKAKLLYPDGKWLKVKYRLRGRNIWHWSEQKPSLRIKTRKKNPISLHRHLNLISPEDRLMLANPFGEELARRFGLMSPNTQMVQLYLNNRYKGVYQLTNREDESFLRYNKRFPGPLYIGNYLKPIWDAKDFELKGDLDVLEFSNPMADVTEQIKSPATKGRLKHFWLLVDKDKLAAWSALMAVVSGTHSDFKHNQVFYLDPTTGKIEPVVSDILALGAILYPEVKERILNKWIPSHVVPINERLTPILSFAMADPTFVHLRNTKIYNALTSFASSDAQLSLLDKMLRQIEGSVLADRYKAALQRTFAGYYRMPYGNWTYQREKKRVRDFIQARSEFVMDQLSQTIIGVYKTVSDKNNIEFSVDVWGHSGANFHLDKAPNIQMKDEQYNIVALKEKIILHPELYRASPEGIHARVSGRRSPDYTLVPGSKTYRFITTPKTWKYIKSNTDTIFENAVTGGGLIVKHERLSKPREKIAHTISMPLRKHAGSEIILGPGVVSIANDLFIPGHSSLTIRPGTQIQLGPDASIVAYGKVIAEGRNENPITLRRLQPDKPWGVFAIVGPKAFGSRIKYFDASGGSVEFMHNIKFSGMISIHHVKDFEINHVKLRNNSIGDDTLRIVSSNVKISDLELSGCIFDCIDFDFVTGKAKNIIIIDAGNDGFDFMSSRVHIDGFRVDRCGDKGISMGELSTISGSNIEISHCAIGIAAKDQSLGAFDKVRITNSEIGTSSYRKNWRYGGAGRIVIKSPHFSNNKINQVRPKKKDRPNTHGVYPTSFY